MFSVNKIDKSIVLKPNTKMSHVNKVLSHSDVKVVVWASLGYDESVVLPSFPNDVLYGRLSEMLHQPKYRSIFLSNRTDSEYKAFISAAVAKYDLAIEEYSEEEAAAAEAA